MPAQWGVLGVVNLLDGKNFCSSCSSLLTGEHQQLWDIIVSNDKVLFCFPRAVVQVNWRKYSELGGVGRGVL